MMEDLLPIFIFIPFLFFSWWWWWWWWIRVLISSHFSFFHDDGVTRANYNCELLGHKKIKLSMEYFKSLWGSCSCMTLCKNEWIHEWMILYRPMRLWTNEIYISFFKKKTFEFKILLLLYLEMMIGCGEYEISRFIRDKKEKGRLMYLLLTYILN